MLYRYPLTLRKNHNISRHRLCRTVVGYYHPFLLTTIKEMRPELREAYWDVIRDEMSYKEAAERHGVNPGQVWKVCKTSVISSVGRSAAFAVFQDFLLLPNSIKNANYTGSIKSENDTFKRLISCQSNLKYGQSLTN